jgi:tetratricopeptide (TPR) repeat protein
VAANHSLPQNMIQKKKIILSVILCVAAMTFFAQSTFNYKKDFKKILEKTKDAHDNLYYNKLLSRFSVNDTTMTDYEVLALLIGFTDKPDYKPYDDLTAERETYNLNGENKYQEGLDLANKFLKTHPLSVKVLFEKSYSYYKLGNIDSAKFYLYKGRRIFKAMSFSGNGKTRETPTFALGPADGQDYIYKVVGGKIGTMGSGRDENGNFIDILEVLPKDGSPSYKLYFIIQHASEKMFGGKSIEEALKEQDKEKKKKK